jgi:hypothetical protein
MICQEISTLQENPTIDGPPSLLRLSIVTSLIAIGIGCGGTRDSGPSPDDDGGQDSETASASDTDSATTEDMLPGWCLIWAEQVGGSFHDSAGTIARADENSFVVTGWFSGEATFGGIGMSGSVGHMFLAKFSIDNKIEWAKWGGHGFTIGNRVVVAPDGRIGVSGEFSHDAVFGSGESGETWLGEAGQGAAFLAVYEKNGNLSWARDSAADEIGSPSDSATGSGLAFLSDGSVVATGRFQGQAVFGEGSTTETTLQSAGAHNAFLVRYDPDGKVLWAKRVGGPASTRGWSIASLPDDSVLLLADFSGEIVVGEGEDNETTLVPLGSQSFFLARFDPSGHLEWAIDLRIHASSVAVQGEVLRLENGEVAVTGQYHYGSMPVGDGEDVVPVEVSGTGLFLARYAAGGSRIWTRVATVAQSTGQLLQAAELSDGTIVVAGSFCDTVAFGIGETTEVQLHGSSSSEDGLLAAWSADGDFLWALSQGGDGTDNLAGLEAFSSSDDGHDIIIAGGDFEREVTFGTGGNDLVELSEWGEYWSGGDIVLLRFDREAE